MLQNLHISYCFMLLIIISGILNADDSVTNKSTDENLNVDPNVQNDVYLPSNIPKDLFEKFNIKQTYNTGTGSIKDFKTLSGLKTSYGTNMELGFGDLTGGSGGSHSYKSSSYSSSGGGGYSSSSSGGAGGYGGSSIGGYGGIGASPFLNNEIFGTSSSITGASAQCQQRPKLVMNASLRCASQTQTCQITCSPDYQFPNGQTSVFLNCVNNKWIIKNSAWTEVPSCEPICIPQCLNNGICISPSECMCPENYIGPRCEHQNKLCLSPPPLVRNSKRTCSSTTCTVSCMTGHRFPDGTSVTNMICKNGEWAPTRPELATIPDCQPVCTPQCQNGGRCLSFNMCQCGPEHAGAQCQYEIAVCSPKKLGFNGSYKCSGTHDELSCVLSCPEGVEFSFKPKSNYICKYEQGIFLPRDIPQCKFASNMKITKTSQVKSYNQTTVTQNSVKKNIKLVPVKDDEQIWREIVEKIRVMISEGESRKRIGGHSILDSEFDDNYENLILPGVYSLYLQSNVDVVMRTPKPAICMTWNGNKFKTFDGLMYNTDLYCSHTLVQDIAEGSFSIILRTCPYTDDSYGGVGSAIDTNAKKCTNALVVISQNTQYTFENDEGIVKLNARKKQLTIPVQMPGMRASMTGHNLKIVLDTIGTTITWDTFNLVHIEASASLFNRTAGLCGTMDQNIDNDFASKDGSIHKLPATFVDAWRAPNIDIDKQKCIMDHKNEVIELDCSEEKKQIATNLCSKLLGNPKLSNCIKECDKESLLKTCISDYCYCKDKLNPSKCACDGVSVFAADCLFRGIKLEKGWRDMELCAIPCFNGRVYRSCGPMFEPSCGSATEEFIETCNEGCFCPTGMLQYESKCVRIEDCPCQLRGKTFKSGSEISKDCNTCKCERGMWKCSDVTCGGRCSAIGDPHYYTFDGKRYDFMGKCSYYLMKTDNFTIEAENVACPGTISESLNFGSAGFDMPSCTKSITINVKTDGNKMKTVQLKQGRLVLVDGIEIQKLPIRVLHGVLRIRQPSSTFILVIFQDGLKVWWDGVTRVYIDAPPSYRGGRTKGLCGTFNSNMQDDFLTPEGDIESSIESFADKWRTKETCPFVAKSQIIPHPCKINMENKEKALAECAKLKEKIFADCHWHVDPELYYEDCMYDMCACKGDLSTCMCPIFSAYANECARHGKIINWRYSVNECAVKCPPGQVFEECGDECYRTCDDMQSNEICKSSCVEGCRCPHGQALDESNECIPIGLCPCTYKGLKFNAGYKEVRPSSKYLELCTCTGPKWMCTEALEGDKEKYPPASDIRLRCIDNEEFTTCEPDEPITCKNMHSYQPTSTAECRPGCVCKKNYVYDTTEKRCVLPNDCSCHHASKSYNDGDKIQSDCNTCVCSGGNWNCTDRQCPSVCTAWGDSHFETFDGIDFDFQGACNYVLAKGSLTGNDGFSVTIQNVLCGSLGVTCSKSVIISITGTDPETLTLSPDTPIPGIASSAKNVVDKEISEINAKNNKKLMIYRAGIFIIVEIPGMDVQIKWDRGTRVYIKVGNRWKGRVQGLCGNNNGDAFDDLKTPSLGIETSPLIFGDSWKLQDFCAKPTEQVDTCMEHPQRKTWALNKCGILKSDVFAPCHYEVPVEKYLKRCAYDACACDQGGDCECLCTALAAYEYACAMKGVPIKWRTPDLCPMQCDPHCSEYTACVSPCPIETCENILEQGKDDRMCIEDSCVEGCHIKPCPENQIYLNDSYNECVPKNICKPICLIINDITYYEGDVIGSDDCQTCQCTRGKKICSGVPCALTTPTDVEYTTQFAVGDGEVKCVSGWTSWINQDKLIAKDVKTITTKTKVKNTKIGDTEPLPNYLLLKHLTNSASCTYENMTNIECRTVKTHIDPKRTGEDVECSLEKGLLCAGPCHDYEIRVFCKCTNEIEEFTPKQPPWEYPQSSSAAPHTNRPDIPIKMIESTTTSNTYPIDKIKDKCDPKIPHIEYPGDCYKFFHCQPQSDMSWRFTEKTCGPSMMYNPELMICDWPDSVIAIKKECGEPIKSLYTTTPQSIIVIGTKAPPPSIEEKYSTYRPYEVTPIRQEQCPPGQMWSECAIPCGRACHYYNKFLQNFGHCTHGSDNCIAGCVDSFSTLSCPRGKFWRDKEMCVSIADCTCMSKEGNVVKPYAAVKESDCETCQCLDNLYICDASNCEEEKPYTQGILENLTRSTPSSIKEPTRKPRPSPTPLPPILVIPSTVSPPMYCDSDSLVPMIEGKHPLPDSAFNASSSLGSSFKPFNSRLHSKPTDTSSGSWSPEINDQMQYLQISFPKLTPLFGVIMGGSPIFDQYVTSFKILHSSDGIAFHYLMDETETPQIFRGPIAAREPVKSLFKIPIESKVIRIYPLTWHDSIAAKVELLGCPDEKLPIYITTNKPISTVTDNVIMKLKTTIATLTTTEMSEFMMCDDPMGMDNGKIRPKQVKFSSFKLPSTPTKKKPFDMLKLSAPQGWRPNLDTSNEYVLFDFLAPRNLTGIHTKGGDYGWVTAYNVLYSPDKFIWNKLQNSDGTPKVFLGNYDGDSVKTNKFKYPIHARYLKVVPIKWHDTIEFKVEPIGCFKPYPEYENEVIPEPDLPEITTESTCGKCPDVLAAPSPIEGICRCYPPLYWNGEECVARTECPCMVGHIQYDIGAIFELEDCSQCVCTINGIAQCKPQVCKPCEKGLRPVKTKSCSCRCEPCPDNQILCESSGACIPESAWCDGIEDCPDDEIVCKKEPPIFETNQVTNLTKTCPPIKCPPGFVIKPSERQQSELKLSAMFQQTTIKKTSTKSQPSTKISSYHHKGGGGHRKPSNITELPMPSDINEKHIEICPEFICIPEKPINVPEKEHIKCPEPECPKGYEIIFDNILSKLPNECIKFRCEESAQKDSVCNITGRTFNTFDGIEFKYDICNHLLARDLVNQKWSVNVIKNCTAGNYVCHKNLIIKDIENDITVTLYTDLTLDLDGYKYTVEQLQKSKYAKLNRFVISKVGNTIVFVSHHHGFWVTFDEFSDIKIGVTTKYHSTVDGLCGFFNDNAYDDKRLPDGKLAKSTIDFGDGWLIDKSYKEQCEPHACPKELQDAAWEMCNTVKNDIFKMCHRVVDVNRFITKCIETACVCLKDNAEISNDIFNKNSPKTHECKCSALQPFVRDCLAADDNIHLDTWRSIEECPAKCEAPLIHKDCYNRRCEPSCTTLSTDDCPHLPGTCFSGCYCPEGTVRKDDECVPVSDCKDCVCDGFGKSQYLTYDRKNFTFNGNCTYLLSRDLLVQDVHTFQVYVTLAPCGSGEQQSAIKSKVSGVKTKKIKSEPKSTGSCAQALHILYGPHIIHLQKGPKNTITTFVDGIEVKQLPLRKQWIEINEQAGREININLPESQVEIQARFDDLSFSLRVPSIKYGMKMEGLCGDCNGNPDDDLKANPKVKTITKGDNIKDIIDTWLADEPALPKQDTEECISEETLEMECIPLPPEDDPCLKIFDEDVFGQCHLIVDPSPYISCCQNDMCKPGAMQEGACSHIDAYARECLRNGICLEWRNTDKLCESTTVCPFGMIYEQCGCPETCETIQNKKNPNDLCSMKEKTEGCVCPKGLVIHDGKCIPEKQCNPCDDLGHFVGDKWYPDKCSECECTGKDKNIKCTQKQCPLIGTVCENGWKQIIINDTDDCCPTYKCVPEPTIGTTTANCTDDVLPLPNCGPGQYNKMIKGADGCSKYICECKPISECEELIKPKLQNGQKIITETSGCCPTYKILCDKSLCPPKIKCTKEFYELVPVESNGDICCDLYICSPPRDRCLIELNGRTIVKKPNELWPTDDPCVMEKCSYTVGGLLIVTDELEKCDKTTCTPGYQLEIPNGKCCGTCVQKQCIIGDEIYEPEKIWYSSDNCTTFKCEIRNDKFLVTSSKETCPDVSACPDHLRYFKGCCQHCELIPESKKNCIPSSLSDSETIQLVEIIKPIHGKCTNKLPVRGFTECMGSCSSGTKYNKNNYKQDRKCECCSVGQLEDIDVKLTCDDGYQFNVPIAVPKSCSCQPCSEEANMGKKSGALYDSIIY